MSFPSLQYRLSVSVIITSHVLEQTHQSMFPILVFLGGKSSWRLLCFSSSFYFKRFSTSSGVSQAQTYMEINLEDLHRSCDTLRFILIFINILWDFFLNVFVWATSKTWSQTLDLDLDPEKPGPWKTWALKNMDPEKHGINMRLKNMSDFRELCFIMTMLNVICTSRFVYCRIWSHKIKPRSQNIQRLNTGLSSIKS